MNKERINEIQEKTMKNKTDDELRMISGGKSSKNWEPEAIEAALRELNARIEYKPITKKDELLDLSSDDLLREQILLLRKIQETLKNRVSLGGNVSSAITDFDMPFSSLIVFMVKVSIAAIPAGIILFLIWLIVTGLLASCGLALGGL